MLFPSEFWASRLDPSVQHRNFDVTKPGSSRRSTPALFSVLRRWLAKRGVTTATNCELCYHRIRHMSYSGCLTITCLLLIQLAIVRWCVMSGGFEVNLCAHQNAALIGSMPRPQPGAVGPDRIIAENLDVFEGAWSPDDCRSEWQTTVILPLIHSNFNQSYNQLWSLLRYLHPIMKRQLNDYRVLVVDSYATSAGSSRPNLGEQLNAALMYSTHNTTPSKQICLLIMPTWLVPASDELRLDCDQDPSIARVLSRATVSLPALSIQARALYAANGFTNRYDSDQGVALVENLRHRLEINEIQTLISEHDGLFHTFAAVTNSNELPISQIFDPKDLLNYETDGLSDIYFRDLNVYVAERHRLYTRLKIVKH